MLYESYKKKIKALAENLRKASFVALICLCVIAAVLILLLIFECFRGIIISDISDTSITYGDSADLSASAFLDEIEYEYQAKDGTWQSGIPRAAGEFTVRGYSKNLLGIKRYTSEASLSVAEKVVHIELPEYRWEYGDTSPYELLQSDELAFSDIIGNIDFKMDGGELGEVRVSVETRSVKIINADGDDVTNSYSLTFGEGRGYIEKRTLTLVTASVSREYDATVLQANDYSVTEGSIAAGHTAEFKFNNSIKNVGRLDNEATLVIKDRSGIDVTDKYDITLSFGRLDVLPRTLFIETETVYKTYDGLPLSSDKYKIVNGSVAAGEALNVATDGIRITDAGIVQNTASAYVTDASGNDVSSNYDLRVTFGSLSVDRREITVSSRSFEKVYDGIPLVASDTECVCELTSGSLAPNETISASDWFGKVTYTGTDKNRFTISVKSADGRDTTANYSIKYEFGQLTVLRRDITVSTGSASKVYDGTPLTNNAYEIKSGSLAPGEDIDINIIGTITLAGSVENLAEISISRDGKNVSGCYNIRTELGTLEVLPRRITVSTGGASKVYDGIPLTNKSYEITGDELAPNDRLNITVIGKITDAGEIENGVELSIYNTKLGNTTDSYEVTYDLGTLTVLKRPVTVMTGTAEKTYDGRPLVCKEFSVISGNFLSVHTFIPLFEGSQTEVGQSENTGGCIIEAGIEKLDKTANYEITWVCGTLTVKPAPNNDDASISRAPFKPTGQSILRIRSNTSELKYLRGISYGDYTGSGFSADPTPYSEPSAESMLCFIGRSIDSTTPHKVSIEYYSGAGILLTPYFFYTNLYYSDDIKVLGQEKKFEFYFKTLSDPLNTGVSFKGEEELQYRKFVYENYLSLPESTRVAILSYLQGVGINESTSIDDIARHVQGAATYTLDFQRIPDGADVALHFLTVSKEGICQHYATAATVIYRALGIPARYVTGYSCPSVLVNEWTDITDVNAHAWVEVYCDGIGWIPVEVTGGYDGGVLGGVLGGEFNEEIDGKPHLALTSYDASKVYDGTPLSLPKYYISKGELRPGHTIEVEMSASITEVGEATNKFTSVIIYDENGLNVTAQYNIEYYFGTLTVTPRTLFISTGSASKPYDRRELSCDKYWISGGELPEGHTLVVKLGTAITGRGYASNNYTYARVFAYINGVRKDVTKNYIIKPGHIGVLAIY